jgi:translation elongation factor EF-1alpha
MSLTVVFLLMQSLIEMLTVGFYFCTSGPSLLEYLDNMQALDRKIDAPLMIPITEKYKDMGTIVVGKIESGKVKKGQTVLVMPNKVNAHFCIGFLKHENWIVIILPQ